MAKDLVIVESPAKARTMARFLGKDFVAKASMGHVRDLPEDKLGVTIDEKGFHPKYVLLKDKRKVVREIAKASREARTVYLATDPDREGEAISWHLVQAAKIDPAKARRVVFHEITRKAIQEAFKNPRGIDGHLVEAQQARRILDRLVGYQLSPLLWRKVRRGLSAGRVQSVALRMVVDREREIEAFQPQEYWVIEAHLGLPGGQETFKAHLHAIDGREKVRVTHEAEARRITRDLEGAAFRVHRVQRKETRSRPAPPFITSSLQQEAWRKLRFSARRTMQVAQQLYEGLPLGDEGEVGLITYMRTDSTHVAQEALTETRRFIRERFGPEYVPARPREYRRKVKGAQEAHEAIRPTAIARRPEDVRPYLNDDQARLYQLVWLRMVASQMADALFDSTTVDVEVVGRETGRRYIFRATGSVMKFPGFRALYMEGSDEAEEDEDEGDTRLPDLQEGQALECLKVEAQQRFTQPPPRYTEASLIKALEEKGIGRPSTYAPIMATLLDRDYVRKEKGRLVPTKLGTAVVDLLTKHFPDIMDTGFTARVEEELDDIARGEREWVPVLREFYAPFLHALRRAEEEAKRVPRELIEEESGETCHKCGRPMVVKRGRYGRFLSCSGFPQCRESRPYVERTGVSCPSCREGELVERRQRGRNGRRFYGCSRYPECDFTVSRRPLAAPCPQCGGLLTEAGRGRARCSQCSYQGPAPEEADVEVRTEEVA